MKLPRLELTDDQDRGYCRALLSAVEGHPDLGWAVYAVFREGDYVVLEFLEDPEATDLD